VLRGSEQKEWELSVAESTVMADDDRVRVTRWTFRSDGDATGQHCHKLDYVVVPVTGGTFLVTDVEGPVRQMIQAAGAPYLGVAGTAHDVASIAGHEAVFVEIELKR